MQEIQMKMQRKLNRPTIFDYNCNRNSKVNDFNNIYPKNVSFTVAEDEKQYYAEGVNVTPDKNEYKAQNNLEIVDTDHCEVVKPQKRISNRTSARRLPNILKHRRVPEVTPTERDSLSANTETNVDILLNSSTLSDEPFLENKHASKESKRKSLPHKRKQEHSFTDTYHELPHWSTYSFIDDKQEIISRNSFASVQLADSPQGNKLKHCIKKYNKKHKMSVTKAEQKLPEFQAFYPLQETEYKNLQDQVDFSTNEIFSNYNYESYTTNKLDYFTDCMIDSDETHNSLSTIHDSEICEKEYDINGNEVVLPSGYWHEDVLANEKPHCLSDGCYGYCLEGCTNRLKNSGIKSYTSIKDKVLTETVNENSIIMADNTNYQVQFNCLESYDANVNINLANGELNEEHIENTSVIIDTEMVPQDVSENIELPFTEVTTFYDEESIGRNVFVESTSTVQGNNSNVLGVLDKIDYVLDAHEEQMINNCNEDALQSQMNENCDTKIQKFQCLLCPLTFPSTRTMAMHQAGAHGGMYVILCQNCGRLFNRKYDFNRHFIHCGRLKEPYKCDMCMRMYRHKSSLVHHLKVMHHVHYTRNRSAKFTCNVCNKVYSKFGAFENHLKRHKEKPLIFGAG